MGVTTMEVGCIDGGSGDGGEFCGGIEGGAFCGGGQGGVCSGNGVGWGARGGMVDGGVLLDTTCGYWMFVMVACSQGSYCWLSVCNVPTLSVKSWQSRSSLFSKPH